MNDTQKERINQVTESTLIVGVDISKKFHVARAQDFRGIECGQAIKFDNSNGGLVDFGQWCDLIMNETNKHELIIGMEPTGPYWLPMARYLKEHQLKVVTVSTLNVRRSKELDDGNQNKNDYKDAKVIAQLIKDGRYSEPNLLEGDYEELRNAKKLREMCIHDLTQTLNRLHNWLDRFFPEYKRAYKTLDSKSLIFILKKYGFPDVIEKYTADDIYSEIRQTIKRGVGIKKITRLVDVAKQSIGIKEGHEIARYELNYLLENLEQLQVKIIEINLKIDEICKRMPEAQKLLKIKGFGLTTVSGILAELGDIKKYTHPKQLIKMAGLTLVKSSSGQKQGKTSISKRGRSGLRKTLYQAMIGMIKDNEAFHTLYHYYRCRAKNQLTGKQAIIALISKLLRIIHAMITKNTEYDEKKLLGATQYPESFLPIAA